MHTWLYLFLGSCLIVAYNYGGYALLALLIHKLTGRKKTEPSSCAQPTVSFIVAAYNEEDCMEQKILNSLAQHYPAHLIEFIFITDGSSDRTAEIVQQYPQIRSLHEPRRQGKSAALNRAVAASRNEILIFSDANTLLNPEATQRITRHYASAKVGGVAGEKKVIPPSGSPGEATQNEGLYWKYESALKKIDSAFYSVVGAAGELFSVRRSLYEPVSQKIILDDFIISMKVVEKGFRVVYEPEAYAMELPSFSLGDEKKRKIRIAAGGFQAMELLPGSLKFWKNFRLSFLYISHRVLRWTLSPICLLVAFVSNAVLCVQFPNLFFVSAFTAQVLFYGMGITAALEAGRKLPKLATLAYYFIFMNVCVVLGFFRHLRGEQSAVWEKAKRAQAPAEAGQVG